MDLIDNCTFIARPGFLIREIVGEKTLVPINTDNIELKDGRLPVFNGVIQLNELALLLWNNIQTPKTLNELIGIVENEYDISTVQKENVREDILEFLEIGIVNQIVFLIEKEGK